MAVSTSKTYDSDADTELEVFDCGVPLIDLQTTRRPHWSTRWRQRNRSALAERQSSHYWKKTRLFTAHRILRFVVFLSVFCAGALFALLIFPLIEWPVHDHFDDVFEPFRNSFQISPFSPSYPIEYFQSVLPIPCHSHNDYWRQRPVFSALGTGCVSIEADVWLVSEELFVGHSEAELSEQRRLQNMYINPLVEILERINPQTGTEDAPKPKGVFYQDPNQTLVLLIDLKTPDAWDRVVEQIGPLRERGYLTYWNGLDRIMGPVTVVASGATPFDRVLSNTTYRDIFYDAPLDSLAPSPLRKTPHSTTPTDFHDDYKPRAAEGPGPLQRRPMYNPSNSYYASASLTRAVGLLSHFAVAESQIELIRAQVRQARDMGLVPRYWGTPRWPRALRDEVWSILMRENVGVLNVDDLRAARKGIWGSWPQGG